MNNAVIIQQVYSDSEYALMVAQVFQRHMEYCLKWHFDYQFILGDVDTRYPKEMGGWAKIPLIQKALVDYEYVVYLDADAYIADMDVDLRDAIQYGIGAVQRLLWCLEPHIQRIATPEAIAFEKFGSDTMDVVVEYTIMDSQFLYNEAVVLEQLKAIYPEEKIRGIDGGFIVPAKPEDIKVLEVLEWAKKVRLA